MRKYSNIKATKLATRLEMQHSASVRRGRAKEIPFGVRALERGVEVEGVWNSKANTPTPSLPGSPALSASTAKAISPFDFDQASAITSESSVNTRIDLPRSRDSQSSATTLENPPRGRPTYQPHRSSGLRISDALDSTDATAVQISLGADSDNPRTRHSVVPLSQPSSLRSHPGISQAIDQNEQEQSVFEKRMPVHRSRPHSPSLSRLSFESNPFLTPTMTRHSIDDDVPAFQLSELVPTESHGDRGVYQQQLRDGAGIPGDSRPNQIADSSQPHRESQVIRKINSGFEILKPGTLDGPRDSSDIANRQPVRNSGDIRPPRKLQKKPKRLSLGTASLNGSNV